MFICIIFQRILLNVLKEQLARILKFSKEKKENLFHGYINIFSQSVIEYLLLAVSCQSLGYVSYFLLQRKLSWPFIWVFLTWRFSLEYVQGLSFLPSSPEVVASTFLFLERRGNTTQYASLELWSDVQLGNQAMTRNWNLFMSSRRIFSTEESQRQQ